VRAGFGTGVIVGIIGYWAAQHFLGLGVTGRGKTG